MKRDDCRLARVAAALSVIVLLHYRTFLNVQYTLQEIDIKIKPT